ncbi:Retrotransposon protein [Nesidiocoris tenuis]|uniref:Retrotransposon protein n=1 Tax=Nesidiocoris tenuis TaxID=355587 RepID=A0ABN7AH59_9HEMI|nr:Retrotransposon protein [Nesidiocoris tenuis]
MIEISHCPPSNARSKLITHPFDWKQYSQCIEELTDLRISLKTPQDVDKAVTTLTRNIQTAARQASAKPIHSTTNPVFKNHFPPHIRQLHLVKKLCRSRWESSRHPAHKTSFNRASRELSKALRATRTAATSSELAGLDTSDGRLWKKVQGLTKIGSRIPPLKVGNDYYCTAQEKSTIFAEQLVDQFQPNPIANASFNEEVLAAVEEPLQLSPFSLHFTPGQVRNAIQRSSTKKAPGHDAIVQSLLRALPRKSLVFLTQIYNAILRTGYYPKSWKYAIITMVHKPGKPRSDLGGYRPISLLPLMSKIFERLLLPHLLESLECKIPVTQFGFRALHSCIHQLHRVAEFIMDSFEEEEVCHGLFADTEKAFDKVWIQGLLFKLKPMLSDTLYRVMLSYLDSRTFSVRVDGSLSAIKSAEAGVPQGSVLGPLMYLIYAHDQPVMRGSVVAQFADDVAVLTKGSYNDSMATLQRSTNELSDWCCRWRTRMNPQKSAVVQFTYKRDVLQPSLRMGSVEVPQQQVVRYLGLHLDSKLIWHEHITSVLQRARHRLRQLSFLLRRQSSLPLHLKRQIYLTTIRPIWLYGCQIWGSASSSQIRRVQTFQNRALRMISGAPWYVRNTQLHRDLQVPEVLEVLPAAYRKHHATMADHPNTLLVDLAAKPQQPRSQRRLKRKRPSDFL